MTLRTDDEVQALRAEVTSLKAALAEMTAQRDRAEYKYRCEVLINNELVDLCRAHKVNVRPALGERPW